MVKNDAGQEELKKTKQKNMNMKNEDKNHIKKLKKNKVNNKEVKDTEENKERRDKEKKDG